MNATTQTLNAMTPLRVGATTGKVKTLLRWEALLIMVGAIVVYAKLSGHWGMFALLFLVPDLSMLGYLINRSVGAAVYNIGHSYVSPGVLALCGLAMASPLPCSFALIWVAHIGFDRMLGLA
ncbi:DUF4260 domain-containing protein [Dyella dinghuensis]|uniref:DUF4260 domain-containing protein n=1 Tax=Dyella dinghuensis TaxID=1920169 RepID=UPI0018F561FB|nr:DUF4260 domain-containing protein [Dyella dinghuensis]